MKKIFSLFVVGTLLGFSMNTFAHSKVSSVRDDRTPTTIYTVSCDFGGGDVVTAETEDASVAQGWLEDCKGLGAGSVEIS